MQSVNCGRVTSAFFGTRGFSLPSLEEYHLGGKYNYPCTCHFGKRTCVRNRRKEIAAVARVRPGQPNEVQQLLPRHCARGWPGSNSRGIVGFWMKQGKPHISMHNDSKRRIDALIVLLHASPVHSLLMLFILDFQRKSHSFIPNMPVSLLLEHSISV